MQDFKLLLQFKLEAFVVFTGAKGLEIPVGHKLVEKY